MQVFPRALKPQSERHRQSPSIINYIALNHNSPTLVTKELILSKTSTKFLCIWVFACMYICVTCMCLVPTEAGRGWWILELTDGCWDATWVLELKPRSSVRAASALTAERLSSPSLPLNDCSQYKPFLLLSGNSCLNRQGPTTGEY